jgi:hypothetical protein
MRILVCALAMVMVNGLAGCGGSGGEDCTDGCRIGELCYPAGVQEPGNACRSCDPAADPAAWTNDDGAACDDGKFCTVGDVCAGGSCAGTARSCDDGVACNGQESCNEADSACRPGTPTCGPDELCDPAQDRCVALCTGCVIGGVCYGDGQLDPGNACHLCDPAVDPEGWTNDDGAACDDGLFCTVGDSCTGGSCGGTARSCDDGLFCNGPETCDEASAACLPGEGPCPGLACDEAAGECVSCPCYPTVQTLRDDFAIVESEYGGGATCYNDSYTAGNDVYTLIGFYRPGCSPANCGAWRVSYATYEAWDYSTEPPTYLGIRHSCIRRDGFNGEPPASVSNDDISDYELAACTLVLAAFAAEQGCPGF